MLTSIISSQSSTRKSSNARPFGKSAHDQRPVRIRGIGVGDGGEPGVSLGDFMDAALLIEVVNRVTHLAVRQAFDHDLERRILLTDDVVEVRDIEARL